VQTLAKLNFTARDEIEQQNHKIELAKAAILRAAEERKQAALLAMSKKNQKGKKKNKKEEEEAAAEEEKKEATITSKLDDREVDLTNPKQFAEELSRKIPRPFTFGPIEFTSLQMDNANFDIDLARQRIVDSLEENESVFCQGVPFCIHGYRVQAKKRTLKRSSTLLKHGRFLENLQVLPVFPIEQEEDAAEGDGEGEDANPDDDLSNS
jgi:hypothetical protein